MTLNKAIAGVMKISNKTIYSGKCSRCGDTFYCYHIGAMYCGIRCALRNGKFIKCLNCGKPKWRSEYYIKHFARTYCGIKCRDKHNRGENSAHWKGGIDVDGYRRIPIDGGKYIKEHRDIMSKIINRPLYVFETVHHKNGIRSDNRPENLELRTGNHGKGQKINDLIQFIIKHYPKELKEAIAYNSTASSQKP